MFTCTLKLQNGGMEESNTITVQRPDEPPQCEINHELYILLTRMLTYKLEMYKVLLCILYISISVCNTINSIYAVNGMSDILNTSH